MSDALLKEVFANYNSNQSKVGETAAYLKSVVEAFLNSEHGQDYYAEPIDTKPANRQCFYIESKEPDSYGTTWRMAVDVMAEGTVRVLSSWEDQSGPEPESKEVRYIHYAPSEDAAGIAAKTVSAMSGMIENDISDAMYMFAKDAPQLTTDASPHA